MNGFDHNPSNFADSTPGPGTHSSTDPFATGTTPTGAGADPYTTTGYSAVPNYGAPGYGAPGYIPPPPVGPGLPNPGLPNPGLATLLGFIPGVGAMYNGQFAKGLAHIVIFAVLVSLSDHVNGIFGLLVAGWVAYMVFDSYQTARARRDGLQIPDPFGLNNIGERMGIGNGPNWSDFTARPVPGQAAPGGAYPYGTPANPGVPAEPVGSPVGASTNAYADPASPFASTPPSTSSYGPTPSGYAQGYPPYGAPPVAAYAAPPVPPYTAGPLPPYGVPPVPVYAAPAIPPLVGNASGLPTGALWLIGFGFFALISTLSHRFYWSNRYLDGVLVTIIGVTLLVTRSLRARTVYPGGTAASTWYVLRSTRVGLFLVALGVAITLDHSGFITWQYVWPYLLILLGVFLLLERAAHNRMLAAGPASPLGVPPAGPAADTYESYPASTSFVPPVDSRNIDTREQEGR